jgi:uncharacterized protein (TIGR02391 family)
VARLTIADKTFLEEVLGMGSGIVLDFTNTSLAQFFDDLGVDIYDERFAEYGVSKANRLRTFWRLASDADASASLVALAEYLAAKRLAGASTDATDEQVAKIRGIARKLAEGTFPGKNKVDESATIATDATVSRDLISIEIHEDIYGHIQRYLSIGDYFHAVEESYKVVREKLRELTGDEAASVVFNMNAESARHYKSLFGTTSPRDQAQKDFFRGVGYLHLGIQFLRNEKAHSLATFVEPNLAIHYISLASLAYDLITRHVAESTIAEIEGIITAKRRSYRSATAFYRDFDSGKWLEDLPMPATWKSASVRKLLKAKWLDEADLTRSYDSSNVVFMRLELVVDELTVDDIDRVLDLPTKDSNGHDQQAGMWPFLDFVLQRHPGKLSPRAKERLAELKDG